jgi:hypothetical protein
MNQEHLHEALIANDALILRGHACCCTTIREYGWLEGDLFAQQRFTQKKGLTRRQRGRCAIGTAKKKSELF